jgi:hypothetical protein
MKVKGRRVRQSTRYEEEEDKGRRTGGGNCEIFKKGCGGRSVNELVYEHCN